MSDATEEDSPNKPLLAPASLLGVMLYYEATLSKAFAFIHRLISINLSYSLH
jgi:hypothetical protein